MIEKEIDMALIGKNFLSYLLGLELINRKQKVLLLDDDRLNYGQLYTDALPYLEVQFLKTWGEDKGIEPFKEIERYITARPIVFSVGDELVRLGGRPSHNFTEVVRKVPEILPRGLDTDWPYASLEGQQEFDEAFMAFAKRVSQNAFRYKSVQNFNTDVFLTHCPADIKSCFESFEEAYHRMGSEGHSKHLTELTFFFMLRGKFQKKFSMEMSRFELFHLFISILSPVYELNQDKLLEDLEPVFVDRGGMYKRTKVREWLFHKSKPWSIELASFDGIVHPKNISLLGADPTGLSIRLENLGQSYGCVHCTFKYKENASILWIGEKYLRCDYKMLGTEKPLWEADFLSSSMTVKVFVKQFKGSKIEFHHKNLYDMLEHDLEKVFPGLWSELESPEFHWGPEVWIEGRKKGKYKGDIPFPKSIAVTNVKGPMSEERLSQVYYFGPYKDGPLGLLSSLMEIKDGQQFL